MSAASTAGESQAGPRPAGISVVIVYEHGLLGEGLSAYLHAALALEPTTVSVHDVDAVHDALSAGPAVVVVETGLDDIALALGLLAPGAVLVDVSAVFARGLARADYLGTLERVVDEVRLAGAVAPESAGRLTRHVPAPASPAPPVAGIPAS